MSFTICFFFYICITIILHDHGWALTSDMIVHIEYSSVHRFFFFSPPILVRIHISKQLYKFTICIIITLPRHAWRARGKKNRTNLVPSSTRSVSVLFLLSFRCIRHWCALAKTTWQVIRLFCINHGSSMTSWLSSHSPSL